MAADHQISYADKRREVYIDCVSIGRLSIDLKARNHFLEGRKGDTNLVSREIQPRCQAYFVQVPVILLINTLLNAEKSIQLSSAPRVKSNFPETSSNRGICMLRRPCMLYNRIT